MHSYIHSYIDTYVAMLSMSYYHTRIVEYLLLVSQPLIDLVAIYQCLFCVFLGASSKHHQSDHKKTGCLHYLFQFASCCILIINQLCTADVLIIIIIYITNSSIHSSEPHLAISHVQCHISYQDSLAVTAIHVCGYTNFLL